MTGEDHKKVEALKTPIAADQPTTPVGTPESSTPTREFSITDVSLRTIAERFDLLAEVGRGGMGTVYRARDRETNEVVALKVLKPEIAARPDVIDRFKTELRLARKITHKNVCRTHDLHRFGDTVVIAMEFVEGESLRSALSRPGGVSLRGGLTWASQICAGLAEAHVQGIVHRDLKPENIVIDRQGQAKVMDFGIARSFETEATQTGTVMGTPAYMSPEQAQGNPVDARSDIYSLGLILYEMFIGRQAFKADTPVAYALKQIHDTPPPPREVEPDLPSRIDRAIQKCLEKNPNKRFQSVTELEAALTQKLEAKPAPAAGEEMELPVHLTRWQRSDWLLVAAAIVGLALFFPFFSRTSLAPRSKVHFDRSVLRRIAQEYAQRLGAPLSQEYRIGADAIPHRYEYIAEKAGALAALELTNNPVPYWEWNVEWHHNGRPPTEVWVDNGGSLITLVRGFPASSGLERLSPEEAKPLAEKALADFFSRNASGLRLEIAANDNWRGLPTTSFIWAEPKEYHGLPRRYTVRFVGREIALLDVSYNPPAGFTWQYPTWQLLPWLALLLVWLVLGLWQRRHVDLAARWRVVTVALAFVIGCWLSWRGSRSTDSSSIMVISTTVGLAIALFIFFASIAVEWSVRRAVPAKFYDFIRLFDRRAFSEPCGLAILRGTFLGLGLLGVDCFLVWIGTSHLGMRLDSGPQIFFQVWPYLRSAGASGHVVLDALGESLGFGFTIGFFASFLGRFVSRPWVAGLAAAALAAAMIPGPIASFGAVQPHHGKVLVLLFDSLLLVWAFSRFDILTLLAAVFTFAFWWQNYRLLVMFEPTGAVEQWIAFAVFGLFVAAAGVIAFQSPLRGLYHRTAAAVD